MLYSDVHELDEESILAALLQPVSHALSPGLMRQLSRATLVMAKSAAVQNAPAGFWDIRPEKSSAKSTLVKAANKEKGSQSSVSMYGIKAEFNSNLLKEKGISAKDERKIIVLREFLVKQAHASRA